MELNLIYREDMIEDVRCVLHTSGIQSNCSYYYYSISLALTTTLCSMHLQSALRLRDLFTYRHNCIKLFLDIPLDRAAPALCAFIDAAAGSGCTHYRVRCRKLDSRVGAKCCALCCCTGYADYCVVLCT